MLFTLLYFICEDVKRIQLYEICGLRGNENVCVGLMVFNAVRTFR
jgi:hypothetical protein